MSPRALPQLVWMNWMGVEMPSDAALSVLFQNLLEALPRSRAMKAMISQ